MNITTFLRFTIVMLLLFSYTMLANGDDLTVLSEVAENRAVAATVRIYAKDHSWEDYEFHGSGFFVKPHLIATNYHVIENKDKSRAKPILAYRHSNKGRFHSVTAVKAFDVKHDLAVLEVSRSRVKPLILSGSETIKRRDRVYVVGFAMGLDSGITSGIINNPKQPWEGVEYIRIDAAVSPGNSGGPVLNIYGDVIGIATRGSWIIAQNLNFAVPSNQFRALLSSHGVFIPPKPKRRTVNGKTDRESVEKAKAEVERAKADTEKARAERAKAEARKVEAEARKVEAEAKKAEAEARTREAEHTKVEAEKAMEEPEARKTEMAKVPKLESTITDQLRSATVHIYGRDRNGIEGRLGTGFFVRKDQVATDFHVVHGSALKGVTQVSKASQSANALFAARVIKTKKAHHLAILQVEPLDAQPLPIANSDWIQEADEIRVFSNTSQPKGEFSERNISEISPISGILYFRFDDPVAPGSGGGPIVNNRGEVVAITTLTVPEISGSLNYAVPSNYLADLLDGEGDNIQNVLSLPPSPPTEQTDSSKLMFLPEPSSLHRDWLERGIEHYEEARYDDAIQLLEPALDGLTHPKNRACAHLYMGFSRRGRGDSAESVIAEFRDALSYDPNVKLPPNVGQNHPVFNPLLEKSRNEFTGTLTINASPPQTQIKIVASNGEIIGETTESVNSRRLFKGDYTVEAASKSDSKREPWHENIHIEPGVHLRLRLELPTDSIPSSTGQNLELTLDLNRAKQPGKVEVHYTLFDESGSELERDVKEMRLQGKKPDLSSWVYYVKLPPSTQGGKIVYRIKVDGEDFEPSQNGAVQEPFAPQDEIDNNDTTTASRDHATTLREKLPKIVILEPPNAATFRTNQRIQIEADVESIVAVDEVRVYYDFPKKQLSDDSRSQLLKRQSSLNTFIGEIPMSHIPKGGYVWYFVGATYEKRQKVKSEERMVGIKKPGEMTPIPHQGLWASHSWSNVVGNEGFYSGWERGNVVSLAFLQEGKGFQTLGAQLDYTYENPDYISAIVQWGPSTRENPVSFAFLAGATGHRSSDPSFSGIRQSSQITPLLGGSLKLFPMDRVTLDVTGSVRLQSENAAANRDANFIEEYLLHYEAGIRLYITPSLNLKAGYGRWRYGKYDNASVQVGLGNTF